jgi:large subunit ribosomal protein L35
MGKLKIRKSISRRFKITKTGKILHRASFGRHLRGAKTRSRIRRLKRLVVLDKTRTKKIKNLLGR